MRRAALAVTLLTLAACSSSGGEESEDEIEPSTSVVCADEAPNTFVKLPAGFPKDFPFPPGTTAFRVDDRGSGGIVVSAVTAEKFPATLKALQDGMRKAGYTAGKGEVEPHDAESEWTKAGYEGRWALRELSDCRGDTLVSVVARAI